MLLGKNSNFIIINNVAYDVNEIDFVKIHYINRNFIFEFITKDKKKIEIFELKHSLNSVFRLCRKLNKIGFSQFAMLGYQLIVNMDNVKSISYEQGNANLHFDDFIYHEKVDENLLKEFKLIFKDYHDIKNNDCQLWYV